GVLVIICTKSIFASDRRALRLSPLCFASSATDCFNRAAKLPRLLRSMSIHLLFSRLLSTQWDGSTAFNISSSKMSVHMRMHFPLHSPLSADARFAECETAVTDVCAISEICAAE